MKKRLPRGRQILKVIQGQLNQENQQISRLLEAFLQRLEQTENFSANQTHLDEDALSAFVEGNLTRRETAPVLQHLVRCGLCRDITGQLLRLSDDLADSMENLPIADMQQNRLQKFLNGFSLSNLGFSDESVFAHHAAPDEELTEADDSTNVEASESEKNTDN
jgi:hypothetical protein